MMRFDLGSLFALGATPEGANPLVQVVPFVLILGIFYFIILLPSKKKQQKVQEFLDNLKVNDKVVTTSGIYGQITRLGDQSVQVQIADYIALVVVLAAENALPARRDVQMLQRPRSDVVASGQILLFRRRLEPDIQPTGAAILSLVEVHDTFQGYDAAGLALECGHGDGFIQCVGGEEWARIPVQNR